MIPRTVPSTPEKITAVKPTTIETHFAALIEEGRDINLSDLVDDQDRALIEAAAAQVGLDALRPIKDQLPEGIGYAAIRLVVAGIKRRQRSFVVPSSGAAA